MYIDSDHICTFLTIVLLITAVCSLMWCTKGHSLAKWRNILQTSKRKFIETLNSRTCIKRLPCIERSFLKVPRFAPRYTVKPTSNWRSPHYKVPTSVLLLSSRVMRPLVKGDSKNSNYKYVHSGNQML